MKSPALLLELLLPVCVRGQSSPETPWLKKGEIQVGVGFSGGWGGYTGFVARTTPYVQYFIKDRWVVRLEGHYEALELGKKTVPGFRPQPGYGDRVRDAVLFPKKRPLCTIRSSGVWLRQIQSQWV